MPARSDAHFRSIAKAVSWRIVGSLDTFIISLLWTGSLGSAGAIASIESVTKIILFYLHERGWSRLLWGAGKNATPRDAHVRSFTKAVSWRALGTLDTFIISSFVTHSLFSASKIAGTETVTKIGLYYLHERAWALAPWGRAAAPEAAALVAAEAPAVGP